MKKKKFRHIHRYAFVDIGNRPWIYESIYNLLTEPAKKHVRKKKAYIIPDSYKGKSPQYILRMLRARNSKSNMNEQPILKKNPDRGVKSMDQVPDSAIKRIPFWKEK